MTEHTRIRTLAPVNLPAKRGTGAAARYPEPAESELLERDLQSVAEMYRDLCDCQGRSDREALKNAIERVRSFSEDDGLGSIVKELDELDKPATRDDIATQLMRLFGCFITNRSELDIRAREMAYDVGAQAPGRLALDIACRSIRRTSKFPPMICEMLSALEEADKKISAARWRIDRLPGETERAAQVLEDRLRADARHREEQIIDCTRRLNDGKSADFSPAIVREARRIGDELIAKRDAEAKKRQDLAAELASRFKATRGDDP